jgi:hypothetical protein
MSSARSRILPEHSVEAQVLGNVRAQRIGPATVADLHLPDPFLRRVANRVLQLSFQENFRIVVSDIPGRTEHEVWKPSAAPCDLETVHADLQGVDAPEKAAAPASRGFMPKVLDGDRAVAREPAASQALAELVAQRLAKDGLLATAARALSIIPAGSDDAAALADAGFPIDLLDHFTLKGEHVGAAAVLAWLRRDVAGENQAKWPRLLNAAMFGFRPTAPGFRASPDSGQHEPGIARLQLSRAGYWIGPGDGGSIDVLRQVLESMPGVHVLASVEQRHVDELRRVLAEWPGELRSRVKLVVQELTVSQWAQDAARGGMDASGPMTLLPRYASRGEEVSLYVAGDTYLGRALVQAGLRVAHSPLLFQGGNLLMVEEPSGRRILLAGEAEVLRNQSLGLSQAQAMAALCAELGADKCVVLPAASIHIDYEVSCRVVDGKVVAFTLDTAAGARLAVEAGIGLLERRGYMDANTAEAARTLLQTGRDFECAAMVWKSLAAFAVGPGRFPLPFAAMLREGSTDSGVGNLHRIMAGLDLLMSGTPAAIERVGDAHHRAYLRSLARRMEDRTQLRAALRNLGWKVVPVPGIGQGDRSINPLNGLHTTGLALMPAYGGLFAGLDAAAAEAIKAALGPGVEVRQVRTSESQRRDGALRCSVTLL